MNGILTEERAPPTSYMIQFLLNSTDSGVDSVRFRTDKAVEGVVGRERARGYFGEEASACILRAITAVTSHRYQTQARRGEGGVRDDETIA